MSTPRAGERQPAPRGGQANSGTARRLLETDLRDERFSVRYLLAASNDEQARALAETLCLEQTVEVPRALVPAGFIAEHIVGRINDLRRRDALHFVATISYLSELVRGDFLNLLNVIFGNSSIKTGLRVLDIELGPGLLQEYPGPRFGMAGLRTRLQVPQGPLLLAAVKPVGLSVAELAELCFRFALAGMDLIKDDHNLADQPWAPFEPRVLACVQAVQRANALTGRRAVFVPNLTGPQAKLHARARFAVQAGAGALMLAPALLGFDAVRELAQDADVNLPIISHPAFGGAQVIAADAGFSHGFYFGTLQRLMGVDAAIFPNSGGRFGFSPAECAEIRSSATAPMAHLASCCPAPGGGMTLANVPRMRTLYGDDVMYLMGGALLGDARGLDSAVLELRRAVGRGGGRRNDTG